MLNCVEGGGEEIGGLGGPCLVFPNRFRPNTSSSKPVGPKKYGILPILPPRIGFENPSRYLAAPVTQLGSESFGSKGFAQIREPICGFVSQQDPGFGSRQASCGDRRFTAK